MVYAPTHRIVKEEDGDEVGESANWGKLSAVEPNRIVSEGTVMESEIATLSRWPSGTQVFGRWRLRFLGVIRSRHIVSLRGVDSPDSVQPRTDFFTARYRKSFILCVEFGILHALQIREIGVSIMATISQGGVFRKGTAGILNAPTN
jgi:hypothetical protein